MKTLILLGTLILSSLAFSSDITSATKATKLDLSKVKNFEGINFDIIEELHGDFKFTDKVNSLVAPQIHVDSKNIILYFNTSTTHLVDSYYLDGLFAKKKNQTFEEALNEAGAKVKVKPFKVGGFKKIVIGIQIILTRKVEDKTYSFSYVFKKDSWEKTANNKYSAFIDYHDDFIRDETSSVGDVRMINLTKNKK